jgi:hypothetical protein
MAKGLEGVRAKIERAVQNFNELHTPIKDWCEGQPYLSVVDDDYNTGWHRIVRVGELPDPPPEWSVIVGEIMHDLRSALDQLAWKLVEATGNKPYDRLEFPCFSRPFDVKVKDLKRGRRAAQRIAGHSRRGTWRQHFGSIDVADLQMLKALQPYRRRKRLRLIPLEELVTFNNIDKHRLLLEPSLVEVPNPEVGGFIRRIVLAPGARVVEERPRTMPAPVKKTELFAFRVEPANAPVHVDMNDRISVGVTIGGDWFAYLSIEYLIIDVIQIVRYFALRLDPDWARARTAAVVVPWDFSTIPWEGRIVG